MVESMTVGRPQGVDRKEPWLSLEDDEQQVRRLIARLAHETWEAVAVGSPAPIVADRFARMNSPQVGDLVVERFSTRGSRANVDNICKGVGYLVAKRSERVWSDDVIASDPDGFTDQDRETVGVIWYIQYGPSAEDVCRWENAEFFAVGVGRMVTFA